MKAYFFGSQEGKEYIPKNYLDIFNILKTMKVSAMSNLKIELKNLIHPAFTREEMARFIQNGEPLMAKIDGLIIEGTAPNSQIGYLIALALTHKKYVLYLLERGAMVDENLKYLKQNEEIKRLLHIKYYLPLTLKKILIEFVNMVEEKAGREVPNIKFTLRITSRQTRYLDWKAGKEKISKADYVRQIIDEIIKKEEGFK